MREIKFRAYIKKLKWLVPVERINFDCKTIEVDLSEGNGDISEYDFDEVELMQYTGLKDKNNKLIYEGDIIKYFNSEENGIFEVKYDCCRFYGLWIEASFPDLFTDLFYLGSSKELQIIGNIYENPELLKEN